MAKITRFRAYQLGSKGSSFSYSVDNHFTLIEARYNDTNKPSIKFELDLIGSQYIDCLHITSWDDDHCNYSELSNILSKLLPTVIEYPGYKPHTENGTNSLRLIKSYVAGRSFASSIEISPQFLSGLDSAEQLKYNNVLYNPRVIEDNSNNNSVVQLFRMGRFTVLSLGDCEDAGIAERIMNCRIASSEVDVMIMAHHGADNGFTTKEFIQKIKPRIAICSSDYQNQYDHPKQSIRNLIYQEDIALYTTKTGDVVVYCNIGDDVHVANLISNSEVVNSTKRFKSKLKVQD